VLKVTVVETNDLFKDGIERYSQTVDALDMQALIQAVNKQPRAPRADKGQPRKKAEA